MNEIFPSQINPPLHTHHTHVLNLCVCIMKNLHVQYMVCLLCLVLFSVSVMFTNSEVFVSESSLSVTVDLTSVGFVSGDAYNVVITAIGGTATGTCVRCPLWGVQKYWNYGREKLEPQAVSFVERLSLIWNVHCRRVHCVCTASGASL